MHILDEAFCHSLYAADDENIYDDNFMYDDCFTNIDDKELIEYLQWYTSSPELDSYVNLPATIENPLRLDWLKECQDADAGLQQQLISQPNKFHLRSIDNLQLIVFQEGTENWKICLTDANVDAAIEFFHTLMCHPGQAGLLRGMRLYYYPE